MLWRIHKMSGVYIDVMCKRKKKIPLLCKAINNIIQISIQLILRDYDNYNY